MLLYLHALFGIHVMVVATIADPMSVVVFNVLKEIAAAVEAMGAYLLFGQADGADERFYLVELHAAEFKTLAYLFHHTFVFGRTGCGVLIQILVGIALKILDYTACDEFEIALRGGEADEGTAINQWRT